MDKGTSIPDEKKSHWITIEFNESDDHYRITSSFKAGPTNFFIDGATVQRRLKDYLALLWQSCEDYRRKLRSN